MLGAGWLDGVETGGLSAVNRCSLIGVIVGVIPGLGGSVVDWIAVYRAVDVTSRVLALVMFAASLAPKVPTMQRGWRSCANLAVWYSWFGVNGDFHRSAVATGFR